MSKRLKGWGYSTIVRMLALHVQSPRFDSSIYRLYVVVQDCNSSLQEAEVGVSEVRGSRSLSFMQ